jgi:class 3 adenylate cyclase/alpha-beta hydrolase superfamily lysophospholipase
MQIPDTQYARAGDIRIAYQVFGSGAVEAVSSGGPAGHIEIYWEEPLVRHYFERLGTFARVAIFDRRGTGASDPGPGPPTLEQYTEDMEAVIDACGFERPVVMGGAESGRMCILFAARKPERVDKLVLTGVSASGAAVQRAGVMEFVEDVIENSWGEGRVVSVYAPSMENDERFRRWIGRLERMSVSPGAARDILHIAFTSDVTDVLDEVKAPTLVLHRRDDTLTPVEEGRKLAAAIPGARFVELPGRDSMGWVGDMDSLLDETEEFLTGRRGQRANESVLGTVLFTDICGSTQIAAQLSDRRWRDLLAEHHEKVGAEIEHAGGEVIKTFGDGVLATFDSAARALRAAPAAIDAVARLGLQLRAGAHTGEIELLGDDVGGLAVHIGARVAANAQPGEVWVTGTIKDILIASGLRFESRGTHDLKGVPGVWPLYALNGG